MANSLIIVEDNNDQYTFEAIIRHFGLTDDLLVNPKPIGVQSLFGNVGQSTLTSGLNIVNPLANIETFDIKTQNYIMSAVHDEGNQQGNH